MNGVILVQYTLCVVSMVILALAIVFCLIRAILGPRVTDRIIAINLIGTKTIISICVLALFLGESGLIDVAIVYALISFLAVVVLVNIYLYAYNKNKALGKKGTKAAKVSDSKSADNGAAAEV